MIENINLDKVNYVKIFAAPEVDSAWLNLTIYNSFYWIS